MTDMLNDPATMTPIERRREIAAILARGVLRVRQDRACEHGSQPSRTVKKASKSSQDGLEQVAQASPDGPAVHDRETVKELEP